MMKNLSFSFSLRSDIGMKRQSNQDLGLARPDLGLFMVADGMGGHRGGETASQMVVERVEQYVEMLLKEGRVKDEAPLFLEEALRLANEDVLGKSVEIPELQGMGTTASVLFFGDVHFSDAGGGRPRADEVDENTELMEAALICPTVIAQVGDSRVYLFDKEGMWQVTRDHSLVQEKLRAGLISRDEVRSDKMKNVITRSVGFQADVQVELFYYDAKIGQKFLLCSDGLTGMLEDEEIRKIVTDSQTSVTEQSQALIRLANERGGDDNITVVLIEMKAS